MSELVSHRFKDDAVLPAEFSITQLRYNLSFVYHYLIDTQSPYAHASSVGYPPWHRCVVLKAAPSTDTFNCSCYFLTSFSSPRGGVPACQWDPEQWLATMGDRFRALHIPVPAVIVDSAGVRSEWNPDPPAAFGSPLELGWKNTRKSWLLMERVDVQYPAKFSVSLTNGL